LTSSTLLTTTLAFSVAPFSETLRNQNQYKASRNILTRHASNVPEDETNNNNNKQNKNEWQNVLQRMAVTTLVTATFWSGANIIPSQQYESFFTVPHAVAKEMASGSGSRVNKDPESLLRLGLPINNKEVCICNLLLMSLII
jgi:hypothetical protein